MKRNVLFIYVLVLPLVVLAADKGVDETLSSFRSVESTVAGPASADLSIEDLAESSASAKPLFLATVMKRAASEYPSILQSQAQTAAAEKARSTILLNSISVTGNLGKSVTEGRMDEYPNDNNGYNGSIGVNVSVSLATFIQASSAGASAQIQAAATKALQMQVATEAAKSRLDYYNVASRISFLEALIKFYGKVETEAKLKPELKTQLLVEKNSTKAELAGEREKKRHARVEYFRLLNEDPIDYIPNVESDDDTFEYDGFKFDRLSQIFPIPEDVGNTAEVNALLAFSESLKSGPALVQARLGEEIAEYNWYLAIASTFPSLTFSVRQNFNDSEFNNSFGRYQSETEGTTFVVGLNWALGAGFFHHISVQDLLRQASSYGRQAVERQIRSALETFYITHETLLAQIHLIDETLAESVAQLATYKPEKVNDDNLLEALKLIESVDEGSKALVGAATNLLLTRIRIHAMMGTLLDDLDELEQLEQGWRDEGEEADE